MTQIDVFSGGPSGPWRIRSQRALRGAPLAPVPRLAVAPSEACGEACGEAAWSLRGLTSNLRYTTRPERDALRAVQPALARTEALHAALIPIRKSEAWWDLAQDERRALFEETSGHTRIGMEYLPAIARRLHHARDLGEPFDFLTWFEYAPEHEAAFDHMLARLRATAEWTYVDREIDIRLERVVA